jgi:hypothetical protein
MKNVAQLNVRIAPEIRKAHKIATEIAEVSLDVMTEAAICFFYGSTSPEVLEVRRKAVEAATALRKGTKLPFNNGVVAHSC